MAYTYSKIATVTVGSGGSSSIDFLAIPQNYTDLVLKISARDSSNTGDVWDWMDLVFNNNTSGYSARMLYGTGSAVGSVSNTTNIKYTYYTASTSTANTFGNAEIYIPNYTSQNYKSISGDAVSENNATAAIAVFEAGLWSNSSPINSIKLIPRIGFAQYSSATLYGIKAEV
jgi:hypothetical protein